MTVQSDLQAAQRSIKLQSDGLKKVTELDHVFVSIQRHDCGEPEELINNQQEPNAAANTSCLRLCGLFVRPLQVTTQGPPSCFAHFVVFTTDFDKRCRHMCAACVPRRDQGRLWKKHFSASSKSDGSLSVSLWSAENDITAHYWHSQQACIYLQFDRHEELNNDGYKQGDDAIATRLVLKHTSAYAFIWSHCAPNSLWRDIKMLFSNLASRRILRPISIFTITQMCTFCTDW